MHQVKVVEHTTGMANVEDEINTALAILRKEKPSIIDIKFIYGRPSSSISLIIYDGEPTT